MVAAQIVTNNLLPRFGPRPVVPLGMGLTALGLVWLTALGATSSYATSVLPPLTVIGLGIGLALPPAMSVATADIDADDAGVASAAVNTMQQVGGSIGTALLNTLAASAAASYLATHQPATTALAQAHLHSYSTAYWWSAGFFTAGALLAHFLYRRGRIETSEESASAIHM